MYFYRISVKSAEFTEFFAQKGDDGENISSNILAEASEVILSENRCNTTVFAVSRRGKSMVFGGMSKCAVDIERVFHGFCKISFGGALNEEEFSVSEASIDEIIKMLDKADLRDFILSKNELISEFDLHCFVRQSGSLRWIERGLAGSGLNEILNDIYYSKSMSEEVARINEGAKVKTATGHPVHYIIEYNDEEHGDKACEILLSALLSAKRITKTYYVTVDWNDDSSRMLQRDCELPYIFCGNGAVVVKCEAEDIRSTQLRAYCDMAKKNRNSTLTIFMVSNSLPGYKRLITKALSQLPLVSLEPDVIDSETAVLHLKKLARNNNIRADKNLFRAIDSEKNEYNVVELTRIFESWQSEKIRGVFYPQYKDIKTERVREERHQKVNSIEDLDKLIGLTSAKSLIKKIVNVHKAQKSGFGNKNRASMHMFFTGNPGTAKTTVARLFAQIMFENGVIKNKNILEVGRNDLVGLYVGHTADRVKSVFERARGGVLFIDEAYSLVDDRNGSFADEAINTIVQEMENNRDSTIVIFAGYPDKMEGFLKKNPGFRSRIPFHIPFDDYNTEELLEIAKVMAEEHSLKLSDEAEDKLRGIFDSAAKTDDFGNGRFVRNIIEGMEFELLGNMESFEKSESGMLTVKAEDIIAPKFEENIIAPEFAEKPKRNLIGFNRSVG